MKDWTRKPSPSTVIDLLVCGALIAVVVWALCHSAKGAEPLIQVRACPDGRCPAPRMQPLANPWTWTPESAAHKSIVRLRTRGGMGCGVIVETDKQGVWIATAEHVSGSGKVDVSFADGTQAVGQVKASQPNVDAAIVYAEVPNSQQFKAVPLAPRPPPSGAMIELAAYSFEHRRLRHFQSRANRSTADTLYTDGVVIPGDSGGPIFYQGKVVGVITGGPHARMVGGQQLVFPAHGPNCGILRRLLDRVRRKPPVEPKPEEPKPVKPKPSQAIDYEKLAAMVAGRIPKPKDGKDGRDGRDGTDGKDSEVAPPVSEKNSEGGLLKRLKGKVLTLGELAAIIAGGGGIAGVAWWLIKRRVKKRLGAIKERWTPGRKRNDQYAEELNDLYQYSGNRNTVQDATLGREYDRRIRDVLKHNSNPQLRDVLEQMRDDAHLEFERIHSDRPAPVPVTH